MRGGGIIAAPSRIQSLASSAVPAKVSIAPATACAAMCAAASTTATPAAAARRGLLLGLMTLRQSGIAHLACKCRRRVLERAKWACHVGGDADAAPTIERRVTLEGNFE